MSFLSNAHTHTTFCDGRSTPQEQLAAAKALGFVSLGFSGHAFQGFDLAYCMSLEQQDAYFAEVRALQSACAKESGAPKLYVGLEQDTLIPAEEKARQRALCDYVIGSTHYLTVEVEGRRPAVDGDLDLLKRAVAEHYQGDPLRMAEAYFELHAQGTEQSKPDIIGHFDLVRKYAAPLGLDTQCSRYKAMALAALTRVRRAGGILEVNTGAIARGYAATPYPDDFLLRAWHELGGEVTLTSDCHDARFLDCGFEDALRQIKQAGFDRVLRLGTGAGLWEEMAL